MGRNIDRLDGMPSTRQPRVPEGDPAEGDGLWLQDWVNHATDDHLGGTHADSTPPSPDEPSAEDDAPTELPKIWKRRDGDATTPDEEEPRDPTPDPTPAGERPELFEREPRPGNTPDDGPVVGGPKVKPEIWTERFQGGDEDGDGVPDGRDPEDPIGSDDVDLSDIVAGPPSRQTVAASPDRSAGTIERPDAEGLLQFEIQMAEGGAPGDALGNFEIQDVVTFSRPDEPDVWTDMRPIDTQPVVGISGGLDDGEVVGISGGLDDGGVVGISGGLDDGGVVGISGGLDGGEDALDG